jgi:hypothetical protein
MHTTFKEVNQCRESHWCGQGCLIEAWGLVQSTSFTIVPMDDFEIVLGQEFMRKEKATPIPHMNSLSIFFREKSMFGSYHEEEGRRYVTCPPCSWLL